MTALTQTDAAILAARHVSVFNAAVAARNFSTYLGLFTDDAVVRFENVPGQGLLEYSGRDEYTKAYKEQPPDDKIDISGTPEVHGQTIVVPGVWRRDGDHLSVRITYTTGERDSYDERLVKAMTVTFPPRAS
jgi:ketosteroid isomerase-like protein